MNTAIPVLVLYQPFSRLNPPEDGRLWHRLSAPFFLSLPPSLSLFFVPFFTVFFPSLTLSLTLFLYVPPSLPFHPNSPCTYLFIYVIPFLLSWRSPWCKKLYPLRWFLFTGWCPVFQVNRCIFLWEKCGFNHRSTFYLTSVRIVVVL